MRGVHAGWVGSLRSGCEYDEEASGDRYMHAGGVRIGEAWRETAAWKCSVIITNK